MAACFPATTRLLIEQPEDPRGITSQDPRLLLAGQEREVRHVCHGVIEIVPGEIGPHDNPLRPDLLHQPGQLSIVGGIRSPGPRDDLAAIKIRIRKRSSDVQGLTPRAPTQMRQYEYE